MAWTAPVSGDWDTDDYFTAANFKAQVLDNLTYLKSAADSRAISVEVFSYTVPIVTGDSKRLIGPAPAILNGYNLTNVIADVSTPSTGGLPTVAIRRARQAGGATDPRTAADMLTTNVTIDANEYSSLTATTAMVVDTDNDDVLTGDFFCIDVDVAGTATLGLWVTLEFAK